MDNNGKEAAEAKATWWKPKKTQKQKHKKQAIPWGTKEKLKNMQKQRQLDESTKITKNTQKSNSMRNQEQALKKWPKTWQKHGKTLGKKQQKQKQLDECSNNPKNRNTKQNKQFQEEPRKN